MNYFDKASIEEIWSRLFEWLITVGPRILIVIVIYLVAKRLIKNILERSKKQITDSYDKKNKNEDTKRASTLFSLANSAIQVVLGIVVVFIVLGQLGIDTGPLIASAGILGLAVGFGAQELVRDVISGFFMLLENNIRIGDVVSINGTGGLVESIRLRTLSLRDFSGVLHVFQHGKINTLSNMTYDWSAMVFDFRVAYKEDPDKVAEVIRETANDFENDPNFKDLINEPLEIFGVDQLGQSEVVIRARYKTKPIQQWGIGREFRKRIKLAFEKSGIEIPFPQQAIHMHLNDSRKKQD